VALEARQRALAVMPERYSSPWGLREPAATSAPPPKLPLADCSRPLEASWLMYWRSCSALMPVPVSVIDSLRTRPPEASSRCQSRSQTIRPLEFVSCAAIASRPFTVSSRRPYRSVHSLPSRSSRKVGSAT
jgi:hypothetical protein